MLVIVGTRTDVYSLRSQVVIGSESDCLLGQLDRILRISDSEAGVKDEKSGVVWEEGECGDDVVGLLERNEGWIFCLWRHPVKAPTVKNYRMFMEQSFTFCMPLLMATSVFS